MKKLIVKLIGISLLAFYFLACDDDEKENIDPTHAQRVVQFATDSLIINEAGNEKAVVVSLNDKALHDGYVTVTFDTVFNKLFTTTPLAANGEVKLTIRKGDSSAEFKITPVDDTQVNERVNISFFIKEATTGYQIGPKSKFVLTIDNNDSHAPIKDSYVNFTTQNLSIKENDHNWHEIRLHVSEAATASGSVSVEIHSDKAFYWTHYYTEPALSENKILLQINSGNSDVTFKIKTVDNTQLAGNLNLTFSIKETTGNIKKGSTSTELFMITDDELSGLPKGFEASGGNWGLKQTYEYEYYGRISKVTWESRTPYVRTGVSAYYYNDFNQVSRINTGANEDLLYQYVNGRISAEQQVVNGIIERYTEYEYDEAGNVTGYQIHYLQENGEFAIGIIGVMLYFPNGNLYKKMVYSPAPSETEEPHLISTETFDNYLNKSNPFPIVDILPNHKTQKYLPTSYRFEGNNKDLQYFFSYDFTEDGKVYKRTTTGQGNSEYANYYYY